VSVVLLYIDTKSANHSCIMIVFNTNWISFKMRFIYTAVIVRVFNISLYNTVIWCLRVNEYVRVLLYCINFLSVLNLLRIKLLSVNMP